uniref:Secreted protein n=1 Tax=Anopheles atroparvus TaxID=41427 RepID=A0AAG5DGY0_ANOAO
MFVLLFLVLALHHYTLVHVLHRDFFRRELLHIQVDLELIVRDVHRRAAVPFCGHARAMPRSVVAFQMRFKVTMVMSVLMLLLCSVVQDSCGGG